MASALIACGDMDLKTNLRTTQQMTHFHAMAERFIPMSSEVALAYCKAACHFGCWSTPSVFVANVAVAMLSHTGVSKVQEWGANVIAMIAFKRKSAIKDFVDGNIHNVLFSVSDSHLEYAEVQMAVCWALYYMRKNSELGEAALCKHREETKRVAMRGKSVSVYEGLLRHPFDTLILF